MFSTVTDQNSTFLSGDCFFTPLKQAMLQCSPKNFRELKYPTQCQLNLPKSIDLINVNRSFSRQRRNKKNQNTIIVQKN